MSRVILIHWHPAEAEAHAASLRAAGYDVTCHTGQGENIRALRDDPPDAFVIDLARSPTRGRDAATFLRAHKATRHVPLLFIAGDPDKTARVRELLPDAVYTTWHEVDAALPEAMAHPPANPAAPGVFAGYSGTPLPKKLGIRPGLQVVLLGAPPDFADTLGPLPDGVRLRAEAGVPADVVLLFVTSRAELEQGFPAAARDLAAGGRLWIAWPKKASGVASDLSEPAVRAFGLAAGLVDFKIAAIDATWAGLCFTRRRQATESA